MNFHGVVAEDGDGCLASPTNKHEFEHWLVEDGGAQGAAAHGVAKS